MLFFVTNYSLLLNPIKECLSYLKEIDSRVMETKREIIPGVDVTTSSYIPGTENTRPWEAHCQYVDLHVLLRGQENIHVGFVSEMQAGTYQPEKDYLPLEGKPAAVIHLTPGHGLLLSPNDAHKVGISVPGNLENEEVFKVVFKIAISNFPELSGV